MPLVFQGQLPNLDQNLGDDFPGTVNVDVWEEKAEFLAAPSTHEKAGLIGVLCEERGDALQHIIPAVVAVGVVYTFEKVNIRDGDAVHGFGILPDEAVHHVQQSPAVDELCERVRLGLEMELLIFQQKQPLTLLEAVAEYDAAAGENHKDGDSVDHLHQKGVKAVQRDQRLMACGIAEQIKTEGQNQQEISELDKGRFIQAEKDQQNQNDQQVLTAKPPAEGDQIPACPGADHKGIHKETQTRGDFFREVDLEQQRGQNHQREPQKTLYSDQYQHKGEKKVESQELIGQLHGRAVILGFTGVLRNLLTEECK